MLAGSEAEAEVGERGTLVAPTCSVILTLSALGDKISPTLVFNLKEARQANKNTQTITSIKKV